MLLPREIFIVLRKIYKVNWFNYFMEIEKLKSQAFDLLRQKEILLNQVNLINKKINQLSEEISKSERQPKDEKQKQKQKKV